MSPALLLRSELLRLEVVVQGELDLPCLRADVGDLAEVRIGDTVVRVVVAGDVESIEEVSAELDILVLGDVELLAAGEVHLVEGRGALRTDTGGAELLEVGNVP